MKTKTGKLCQRGIAIIHAKHTLSFIAELPIARMRLQPREELLQLLIDLKEEAKGTMEKLEVAK